MKIANPFERVFVAEKYQGYLFFLILLIGIPVMYFSQKLLIESYMLIGAPMDTQQFYANANYKHLSGLVLPAIVFTAVLRYVVLCYEAIQFNYKRRDGRLSASYIYFYLVTHAYSIALFIMLASAIAFVLHYTAGLDRETLYTTITDEGYRIKAYVLLIPTLIDLPGAVAAVLIYLVWSFAMYAIHYLGHSSRLYWLLAHRPHHVGTALTNLTHFIPEMKFVIGWIYVLVQAFVVAAFSRLITTDQLTVIYIFFVFAVFYQLIEIFNHTTVLYPFIKNNPLLRPVFRFFMCGPYHVLHHSAHKGYEMVNLGGNSGIWDFAFGTFKELPENEHVYGLTNQPDINMSANAIVFSGIKQIWYELKHNKSLAIRWKIIFGGVYYIPPISKSFLIRDNNAVNVCLHQIRD